MSRPSLAQQAAQDQARTDALADLMGSIYAHVQAGSPVPCVEPERGHLWASERAAETEAAAWRCRRCPAIEACRTYVTAFPEPAGVWAGTKPTERNNR